MFTQQPAPSPPGAHAKGAPCNRFRSAWQRGAPLLLRDLKACWERLEGRRASTARGGRRGQQEAAAGSGSRCSRVATLHDDNRSCCMAISGPEPQNSGPVRRTIYCSGGLKRRPTQTAGMRGRIESNRGRCKLRGIGTSAAGTSGAKLPAISPSGRSPSPGHWLLSCTTVLACNGHVCMKCRVVRCVCLHRRPLLTSGPRLWSPGWPAGCRGQRWRSLAPSAAPARRPAPLHSRRRSTLTLTAFPHFLPAHTHCIPSPSLTFFPRTGSGGTQTAISPAALCTLRPGQRQQTVD